VFHMTGTGGRTLESLAAQGLLAGVLDATTTELADELVGGIFSAGPDRLSAAGKAGIPQVVSVGALDMVNFGPMARTLTAEAGATTTTAAGHIPRFIDVPYLWMCCERIDVNMAHQVFRQR